MFVTWVYFRRLERVLKAWNTSLKMDKPQKNRKIKHVKAELYSSSKEWNWGKLLIF